MRTADLVVSFEKVAKFRQEEESLLEKHKEDIAKLFIEVAGDEDTQVDPFIIQDNVDLDFAMKLLLHVKKNKKELENRQKTATKPWRDLLEFCRGIFRDPIGGYEVLEKALKKKIGAYELLLSQKESEVIAKIAQASKEGDFDKAHAASLELKQDRLKVQGVTTTEKWIVDEEKLDLEKVPEGFIIKHLNKTAVADYIRKFGKGRPKDLPGLVFKKHIAVSGSTKG